MNRELFQLEPGDLQPGKGPAVTLGLSSAALTALLVFGAHAVFGDAVMPFAKAPPSPVSVAVLDEIKTALQAHQLDMKQQIETDTRHNERVEHLLTIMCIQQAKSETARTECLR